MNARLAKRHTTCHVKITRCVLSLFFWGGGYPSPVLVRGTTVLSWLGGGGAPVLSWPKGYPSAVLAGEYPSPVFSIKYPSPVLDGGYPRTGVPPCLRLVYPLPESGIALTGTGLPLPQWDWDTPTWDWGTLPRKDMGPVKVLWDGNGVNPPPQEGHGTSGWRYYGMEIGFPHPPPGGGQTEKLRSIILRMRLLALQ